MASPVTQALFTLVALLEALEVPYMVMGGFAVRVWGIPRPTLEERTLLFISPEDLVLHKLIAGLPRDLGDVADVLLVQGRLDVPYMLQWAQPLRVHDLLIGHLRSAGYET